MKPNGNAVLVFDGIKWGIPLRTMHLTGDALIMQLDWMKGDILVMRLHLNGEDPVLEFDSMKRGILLMTKHLVGDVLLLQLDGIKWGILVMRLHGNGEDPVLKFDEIKSGILLWTVHPNCNALIMQLDRMKCDILVMRFRMWMVSIDCWTSIEYKEICCWGEGIWMVLFTQPLCSGRIWHKVNF